MKNFLRAGAISALFIGASYVIVEGLAWAGNILGPVVSLISLLWITITFLIFIGLTR